jgi:hypothetical protein
MAYEQTLRTIGAPASADLSASQFCFVVVNASGRLALPAAGSHAEGILQDKPNGAGVYGDVGILGVSKVLVGAGGVTAGDLLASDANGKAVTATAGNFVLGRALATGAAGTYVPALIQQKGKI